jgi:hypothetical protein
MTTNWYTDALAAVRAAHPHRPRRCPGCGATETAYGAGPGFAQFGTTGFCDRCAAALDAYQRIDRRAALINARRAPLHTCACCGWSEIEGMRFDRADPHGLCDDYA